MQNKDFEHAEAAVAMSGDSSSGAASGDDFYDLPTMTELLESVREFLHGQVMAETSGSTRFHARVAGNVVAIVERQLAAGAEPAQRFHADLATLGCADATELVAGLREGRFVPEDPRIPAVLRAAVEAKLRVDNPSLIGDA
ncbi:DUF6285 domain-containing protein [Gordonia polyisoprenivorans]|uniref:DUF6285 domain-containing protein n=1 Tax=Gordonia polyisoprenivorans TaxID=84595 RepID=UPI0019E7BA90|nr:hypothetical protein [Gordonia polyisoprenivorans]UZF58653.1 DUF6285 domain-containing protein [Gordonia polyisoprenivorans]